MPTVWVGEVTRGVPWISATVANILSWFFTEESKKIESFDCTLEEFLEEVPDPNAEFYSNNYIRRGYEGNAEIYLETRYSLPLSKIEELLKTNNYNLTKVCDELDMKEEICKYDLEDLELHHKASVFFHREIWYIEHKREIQNFLDSALTAAEIEELLHTQHSPRLVEEIFECEICGGEVTEYSQLGTCDGAEGHLFCLECVKRHIEIKFSEGLINFPCLSRCKGYIPLQTAKDVLSPKMFDTLMDKIQEEEVRLANIPSMETCSFCPFAYLPGDDELFYCKNPRCMKESCRLCKRENHSPELCAMLKEEDEETARLYIEDKMAEALIRHCHKCAKPIVKSDGCNKMACTCGALMCYLCRQPVVDYSHFNGPGGNRFDRCELYSDDSELHDKPVAASAQRAIKELVASNPTAATNLDWQKLVPK